ncbi:disintegrin and metalloproteinase domain-containing protein 9-like isoform X1 [Hyperolius riggenbachi]|uniref:disintegrin and metalloproteinase domain-containing protein 9-like isoform X1 n=1 Tax=Hyperolius riggenbachi TaxID=752182 RepID=UPI0035A2F5C4
MREGRALLLWLLFWGHHVFGLPNEEIVFPERVLSRERRDAGQNHTDEWEDKVSYIIPTSNGTLLVNLQRNRDFISKDFQHFSYSQDGGLQKLNTTVPKYTCYYYGEVDGMEESVVAVSTCHGFRGVMYLSEVHYGIEPLEKARNGEHRLYRLEEPEEPSMCGVEDFSTESPHMLLPAYFRLRRRKRAILVDTNYVELGVVVDNLRYVMDNSNSTAVETNVIQLVNIVDGMFRALNIRVAIINLVTWTSPQNPIDVSTGTAGDVLGRFADWRDATKDLRRGDIYHLLIGHGAFPGGVIGMAFVGTVCSPRLGTSISTFSSTPASHATVMAHELGHVLGMGHDDSGCPGTYIMHSADIGGQKFSSCSADDFESLITRGGGACLRNPPDPGLVLSIPECGNGLVEHGEECDCGSVTDCKNPCCNAATCRLTSGSQCAQGMCCDNCKYKVAGTPCRGTANICDLPEYCNGTSGLCPTDVYIMNGYSCNNNQSYCYGGVCQDYNAQCQALLGPGTTKANDVCFQAVNIVADKYGNCGMVSGNFKACSVQNSGCGKIQCTGSYNDSIAPSISISNVKGFKCVSAYFDLGSDVPDPGLVHEGTGCAPGKACVDYQCVNASELGFSCDIAGKCHNNGVCNNNGNCHCNDGWAPPSCDRSGYGGSIDSGPTHIDTSLRDGLLIFFLLVVPIIIVVIVLFIKRDALRRRFCRKSRRKRATTEQRKPQQHNVNRQAPRAPNNQQGQQGRDFTDVFTISHNIPARPPPPPVKPQQPVRPPPPRPTLAPINYWEPSA